MSLELTFPNPKEHFDVQVINNNFSAVSEAVEENETGISAVADEIKKMNRTITARTEEEVREALQFASNHPGSYLYLTLAANLNVTVPTLYFRNCTIHILGTMVDKEISNTVTFEKTGTTSNLHFQNSMLHTVGIKYVGNTTAYSRGIGVIRGETGSSIFMENVEFEKAEGSGAFGNNVEVQNVSELCAKNCVFRSMSTSNPDVAAVVFCQNGAEATLINCSVAEDSVVTRIANAESGGTVYQIGTDYEVAITNYGMYAKNGVWQNQS